MISEIERFVSSQRKIAVVLGLDDDVRESRPLHAAPIPKRRATSDAQRSALNAELSSMSAYAEAALTRMRSLNKEDK